VAAAYLARAGLDVTVLERRAAVGGATVTEEVLPGYRASTCAFVLGLLRPRILRELELKRHGLELFSSPDVMAAGIWEDRPALLMWRDLDRTLRELERQFGTADAQAFLRFGRALQRVGEILDPLIDVAPPPLSDLVERFERIGEMQLFSDFFLSSIADLLDGYFSSDQLKGFLAFPAMVSLFGAPTTPGSSYLLTHHSVGRFEGSFGRWGFVRGGMGGLADALRSSAEASGARVRVQAAVDRIRVDGDRVTSVELASGELLPAEIVVSAAEPSATLLSLVGERALPRQLVEQLRRFDLRGSMARVFVAVEELPRLAGLGGTAGTRPEHHGHLFLGPELSRYEAAWDSAKRGELPKDFTVEARIESALDDSLVPAGRHLIVTGVQQLPRELADRTWDDARPELERAVVDRLIAHAPNLEGRITATRSITPLDLEREYGITGGNIYHGAMSLNQLVGVRPLPGMRPYRTPIHGLYLGSSGSHPGGGVTGAPGRNAAMAVLADLQVGHTERWAGDGGDQRTLVDAILDRPRLRRLAFAAAKQPLLRPLARRAVRKP
jgi:phytoene dehydrogenase-like protein